MNIENNIHKSVYAEEVELQGFTHFEADPFEGLTHFGVDPLEGFTFFD